MMIIIFKEVEFINNKGEKDSIPVALEGFPNKTNGDFSFFYGSISGVATRGSYFSMEDEDISFDEIIYTPIEVEIIKSFIRDNFITLATEIEIKANK